MYKLIMMFSDYSENIPVYISIFIGYLLASLIFCGFIIPVHNYLQAFIALKLGDNSVKDNEFLTLNPLRSFHLVGFVSTLVLRIGFSAPVFYRRDRFANPVLGTVLIAFSGPLFYALVALVLNFMCDFFLAQGFLGVESVNVPISNPSVLAYVYHCFISIVYFIDRISFLSALVNLIPVVPFDFGDFLSLLFRPTWLELVYINDLLISLGFMVLFFFTIGKPGGMLENISTTTLDAVSALYLPLFGK